MFKDKTLLITGGTGSFGNAVLSRVLETDIRQITIFSRDEEKQHRMRNAFKDERIKYVIGDVRDFNSIQSALKEEDYNGFISKGQRSIEKADEYNSFNTRRLEKDELEFLLNGLGYQK